MDVKLVGGGKKQIKVDSGAKVNVCPQGWGSRFPVEEAKKQLSFKYLHLDFTKTGILDYILDVFTERLKIGKINFLDWLKNEYNAEILNSSFKSRIEWKRTAKDLMEFSNAKHTR